MRQKQSFRVFRITFYNLVTQKENNMLIRVIVCLVLSRRFQWILAWISIFHTYTAFRSQIYAVNNKNELRIVLFTWLWVNSLIRKPLVHLFEKFDLVIPVCIACTCYKFIHRETCKYYFYLNNRKIVISLLCMNEHDLSKHI